MREDFRDVPARLGDFRRRIPRINSPRLVAVLLDRVVDTCGDAAERDARAVAAVEEEEDRDEAGEVLSDAEHGLHMMYCQKHTPEELRCHA